MLVTLRAKRVIDSANYGMTTYTNNLPTTEVENTDDTIILVTDVSTKPKLYGNAEINGFFQEVEVQVFYKLDNDDPSDFEAGLIKLFKNNNWSVEDIHPHTVDPKTYQMSAVFYFGYLEIEN